MRFERIIDQQLQCIRVETLRSQKSQGDGIRLEQSSPETIDRDDVVVLTPQQAAEIEARFGDRAMGHLVFVPKLCLLGDVPNAVVDPADLIHQLFADRLASGPNSAAGKKRLRYFTWERSCTTNSGTTQRVR